MAASGSAFVRGSGITYTGDDSGSSLSGMLHISPILFINKLMDMMVMEQIIGQTGGTIIWIWSQLNLEMLDIRVVLHMVHYFQSGPCKVGNDLYTLLLMVWMIVHDGTTWYSGGHAFQLSNRSLYNKYLKNRNVFYKGRI